MSSTVPVSTKLTPEEVIAQLRALQSQISDVTPLTQDQRKQLKQRIRIHPKPVLDAAINVIGVLDNVSQAIGQPLDQVRQLQDETLRWEAVAEAARAFLKGIEGANLVRQQQLSLIATQAYTIGTQLAKDPAKALLVPHVEEVKRLKVASRRRKTKDAVTAAKRVPPAHDPSASKA